MKTPNTNIAMAMAFGASMFCSATATAADLTFLTHPSLNGLVTLDPYIGNADDANFARFGTNSIGAAMQFSASNSVYGFIGGTMTVEGVTAFGTSPQQYFGRSQHTAINNAGQWSLNSAFIFNRAFTQTLNTGTPSVIELARDKTYTTSFVLNDGVSGGRLSLNGTGRYIVAGEDPATRFSGDLLKHFQTLIPLLPANWTLLSQEDQFWTILDGPRAGVTGFTTATFFSTDPLAVPLAPPEALASPWVTTGFAATFANDPAISLHVGDEHFGAGTATLSGASFSLASSTSARIEIARSSSGVMRIVDGAHLIVDAPDASIHVAPVDDVNTFGALRIIGTGSRVDAGQLVAVGVAPDLVAKGGVSTLQIADGGVLQAGRVVIGAGGSLFGNGGTIIGDVEVAGFLEPGESPGVLTVDGDLRLDAGSQLLIEWAGATPDLQDRLIVSGEVTLGGTVEIVLLDGYQPQAGDSLDFLEALSVAGGFDQILLPTLPNGSLLAIEVGPDGATVVVSAVPVPAALPMLAGGLLLMARCLRTRRRDFAVM